jgi:outer membrane protein OmpA-like peptidoglycan-associated protein
MRWIVLLLLLACAPYRAFAQTDGNDRRFIVYFEQWSAAIDAPAQQVILGVAKLAQTKPKSPVTVTGYADTTGSGVANILLSKLRAQVVTDLLEANGVAPGRVHQVAEGSTEFVMSSLESRRVAIQIGD